jgi:ATP:ADP antiporter, AAA family
MSTNSTGEFLLGKLVMPMPPRWTPKPPAKKFIGGFYSELLRLREPARLPLAELRRFARNQVLGVRGALFILPDHRVRRLRTAAGVPGARVVRFAKILENATDYSIMNTVRQALYLLTSREAKYKAKAAIDTFVVRAGDMLQALVVLAGTPRDSRSQGFAGVTLGCRGSVADGGRPAVRRAPETRGRRAGTRRDRLNGRATLLCGKGPAR